ncbi:MAG: protein kinase domain-containing protein, partial [Phycisphaerae bacterium]
MAEGLKPRLSAAPGTSGILIAEQPPELLAGYRVIRQIGQGGMGVVCEAEHPHLSRRMAIKILPGKRENTTLGGRFRREAESASRLNHPNIVPVYDFGSQNGVQYLTMPLVNGRSLDRILDEYRSRRSASAGGSTVAGQ